MSAIFHDYANYYNLIYENKDYRAEIEFVDSLFKAHATQKIKTLLELGSGTGKHAYHLAQKGFHVHGIDQSETMLAVAKDYFAMQPKTLSERVHFSKGDVRSLSLKQSFDAALSLFHVMSYQINQSDIDAAFETVKKHVVPGGIFVFDCWYGPAVLSQSPQVRYKHFHNEALTVERVAVPALQENNNTVKVDYHLFIREKNKDFFHKIEESHWMRYFFLSEIQSLCTKWGMTMLSTGEWLTSQELSRDTWNAYFVLRV